jgi:hypothetical protein
MEATELWVTWFNPNALFFNAAAQDGAVETKMINIPLLSL